MTREDVKKNMDIISAFAEGKVIQISNEIGEWIDLTERDGLPMGTLEEEPNIFRIKPEPKYRPFANAEECWAEMYKHEPFGWVKTKDKGIRLCMSGLNQKSAFTQVGYKYDEAFDKFIFADGTPFGVKVEE
nr:MAG TPA: hypothetical protein [Caudoviricetes sp.]